MAKRTLHDDAYLGLGDTSRLKITSPFTQMPAYFAGQPDLHLYSIMRPDISKVVFDATYLAFTCKHLLNINLLPLQAAILEELWNRPFPMFIASRGLGKSFLLAVYATLRCALIPGSKVVIVGAAFRQSKIIFEYMETIWHNAPILRSAYDSNSGPRRDVDRCTMHFGKSWAIAIPLGDGQKIRGLRAHIIIADEFSSIPIDIYETVVSGFAAVKANPFESVKRAARRKAMQKEGVWTPEDELEYAARPTNQSILSGTADYDFKHFASYWKRYKSIILSRGDRTKLQPLFPDGVPDSFNWRDYCVLRIPYELIPEDYMDDNIVTRAKATVHSGIYQMEYGAVFPADSEGFFKRSLIEGAVTSDIKPAYVGQKQIYFDARIKGDSKLRYVYGIDPASEQDNFTIVVIELYEDHRRLVYCWATNKKDFRERQKRGLVTENDFYGFCARKIRDLMKVFPVQIINGPAIALDSQGGGVAVAEALHDPSRLREGEALLWPTIDPNKPKDTDAEKGLHILELVNFADSKWTSEANHGLRKDLESANAGLLNSLLFPRFDPISLALATAEDQRAYDAGDKSRLYDSLDDCVMEIEEMKTEMSTIVMTMTGTGVGGRERWDTPEVKLTGGRKGRLRKDRYSALLMANMLARQIQLAVAPNEEYVTGGFARDMGNYKKGGVMYRSAPDWWINRGDGGADLGIGVVRR